jgi:hypothetical protein
LAVKSHAVARRQRGRVKYDFLGSAAKRRQREFQGLALTFSAPATGPSRSFGGQTTITVPTNAEGVATAPPFTANSRAGSFVLVVTARGVSKPAKIGNRFRRLLLFPARRGAEVGV